MGILAGSPAGYAFGLLSLLPANDLRLMAVGTGEVAGTPATTYVFGDTGQCRGTVETQVWMTGHRRMLQISTIQLGSGGRRIETMSLTFARFGLPVTVAAPPLAVSSAASNGPTDHVGGVGSSGSFKSVSICSP
jgi:hypothetical protein